MPEAGVAGIDPLARALFGQALLRGSFTLRSGAQTDRYFDKYRITCDPRLLRDVTGRMSDMLRSHAPGATRIVAPAVGAVPLATALSLELGIPFAIVRAASGKHHGTANVLEGRVEPDELAVLVEDVVTSGGAALDAVQAARAAGLRVEAALCLLDRGGGGRDALAAAGVDLHALLTAHELEAAFDAGLGEAAGGA